MTILVRHFAAARAAAGVDEEKVQVDDGARVADVLAALREEHGPDFARVLARCSYLLDEVAVRNVDAPVGDATTLDVLPPFAGG